MMILKIRKSKKEFSQFQDSQMNQATRVRPIEKKVATCIMCYVITWTPYCLTNIFEVRILPLDPQRQNLKNTEALILRVKNWSQTVKTRKKISDRILNPGAAGCTQKCANDFSARF